MKISFKDNYEKTTNWAMVISDQHSIMYYGNLVEWINWLENEWKCKVEMGKFGDDKCIAALIFEDDNYLLAVLKYGPPAL